MFERIILTYAYSGVAVILILLLIIILICMLLFISILSGFNEVEQSEYTTYECGFMPFSSSRIKFDIKFYLISVLFILFDLEIILLFPFTITLYIVGKFGYFNMIFFILVLTIGFIYEWHSGCFDFISTNNK